MAELTREVSMEFTLFSTGEPGVYFSWEHPPKTKEYMAVVDAAPTVEMTVKSKTQREERERALLVVDMFLTVRKNMEMERIIFVRERERERNGCFGENLRKGVRNLMNG
jgi:hypothetical protein